VRDGHRLEATRVAIETGSRASETMTRYVALLRGINVGGNRSVSMSDLRHVFESAGFAEVGTYIQSGNVLFTTDNPPRGDDLEAALADQFDRVRLPWSDYAAVGMRLLA
jgi:hypothetical protein